MAKTETHENKKTSNIYICEKDEPINEIIKKTYKYSLIFSYEEYKKRFIQDNKIKNQNSICSTDTQLQIPEFYPKGFFNTPLDWNKPAYAIYVRWDLASLDQIMELLPKLQNTPINSLVIDAKDIVGILSYESSDPQVRKYQTHPPTIMDFNKLVYYLHQKNFYVIVRQALFQDMNLIKHRKDLAIYNRNTASKTIEFKGQPVWVDPAKKEVQEYNLRIFKELLSFGVDEIQFDYVRYPAEGDLSGVVYERVQKPEDKTKILKEFLFQAWWLKYPTKTKLSLDVFGITGWQVKQDIEATGQNIPEISIFIDYISPMLYPSHFNRGFEGIPNPADYPEYFYEKGMKYFHELVPNYVKIRPWIQAFRWRVTEYNETYIIRQIQTIEKHHGFGWIMWNAANDYRIPLDAIRKKDL
ncbi:MAG: putative glycoside hydrolase [Leptospiraceae bacterium]|nr:putative glycoside hydrolase [Leptospiraceae bacterium]MDW7976434.1 putative glycoside hydrolase [Leptospiraceae bacterium]